MHFASVARYFLLGSFTVTACYTMISPLFPSGMITSWFGDSSNKTLVIGIFPRRHATITKQIFTPLSKHLADELGVKTRIVAARNFREFWKGVKEKKYDLVHFNQYHYITSKKKFGYEVIAMNEERGRSTITGTLIVRKDSGIDSVNDLKGRTILFGGGPKAMQSYIFARFLLEQAGVKKDEYITQFASNPPSAIISTFYGLNNAAAAGAGDAVIKIVEKQVDTSELKVLAKGKQFAHLPWAVKHSMDKTLKKKITAALLNLKKTNKGQRVLRKAKLTNIVAAKDSDFNPHRHIVKAVLGESL